MAVFAWTMNKATTKRNNCLLMLVCALVDMGKTQNIVVKGLITGGIVKCYEWSLLTNIP